MVDAIQDLVAPDDGPESERPPVAFEEPVSPAYSYSPSVLNTLPRPDDGNHDMNLGEAAESRHDAESPASSPPSIDAPPDAHPPPPDVPHLADGVERPDGWPDDLDDLPLERLLPPAAPVPGVRGPRAPAAMSLTWTDVQCESCHQIAGQLKYNPGPSRNEDTDPPTWFMRVKDGGSWPSKGPYFKRRLARIVGDSDQFCRNWIRENRTCCQNA